MDLHALVIEPDAGERRVIRDLLCRHDWKVCEARSTQEALEVLDKYPWALAFCDAYLNEDTGCDSDGFTILSELKKRLGTQVYVVMTGTSGRPDIAFGSLLNGASDYIRKPCEASEIRALSQAVLERLQAAQKEVQNSEPTTKSAYPEMSSARQKLIGASDAILSVLRELAKSLRSNYAGDGRNSDGRSPTYLITGETGTGKELVARMIHDHSRYRNGAFLAINCSNLPGELADAELFGSSPGAYTGASKEEQPGLWELASGGTLFLDEITEAPPSVQPKLLRVLQDGQIKRLGAKYWVGTNVQVIAASNRDIEAEVRAGRFRADLYYRLNLHHIHLPPLRERQEDVPLLAAHFAKFHSADRVRLAHDAIKSLIAFSKNYAWHGNIRELENVVCRAVMQSPDETVYAVDLEAHLPPTYVKETCEEERRAGGQDTGERVSQNWLGSAGENLEERVRRFRRDVVKETLAAHNGNRSQAASALGVSRPKLHRLLKESEQHSRQC